MNHLPKDNYILCANLGAACIWELIDPLCVCVCVCVCLCLISQHSTRKIVKCCEFGRKKRRDKRRERPPKQTETRPNKPSRIQTLNIQGFRRRHDSSPSFGLSCQPLNRQTSQKTIKTDRASVNITGRSFSSGYTDNGFKHERNAGSICRVALAEKRGPTASKRAFLCRNLTSPWDDLISASCIW